MHIDFQPAEMFEGKVMQTRTGWKDGLIFETKLDTTHLLESMFDTIGIRLHFGREVTLNDAPVTVPADSIGYLKIKLNRRISNVQCINRFQFKPKKHENLHEDIIRYAGSHKENARSEGDCILGTSKIWRILMSTVRRDAK